MTYIGDFAFGQVVDHVFASRDSVGTPSTLSGPALAVYGGISATQFTTNLSLTTDFDGVAGLNHVRLPLTDAATCLEGQDYAIVFTAGQVSPTTIVGEVAGRFSIS